MVAKHLRYEAWTWVDVHGFGDLRRCSVTTLGNRSEHEEIRMDVQNSTQWMVDLAKRWRRKAKDLSKWPGNEGAAAALKRAASQLERTRDAWLDEELTMEQSAKEGKYSVDHVGRILNHHPTLNSGKKHRPRLRRRNVPVKPVPGPAAAGAPAAGEDASALLQDIVSSKYGG
jgi:hypothetical protein